MNTQTNEMKPTNEMIASHWNFANNLVLERVLLLLEHGLCEEADTLATSELLFNSTDAELWLVAGLARFQKGNLRTARTAFKMSAWINDNALAREMLEVLDGDTSAT